MITFKHKGGFKNSERFFDKAINLINLSILNKYGKEGVKALSLATPKDSGKTSDSWVYEIARSEKGVKITWSNLNRENGIPVAILIQYGHGLRNGGYIQGRDFINPAIQPVFDKILDNLWGEVRK